VLSSFQGGLSVLLGLFLRFPGAVQDMDATFGDTRANSNCSR